MASGLSPTLHIFVLVKCFFLVHHYGTNNERLLNIAVLIKMEFLARSEDSTLPNVITSHIAWYNEICVVCSIREYRFNVAETY